MLLRVVHCVLEIKHDDICTGMCGFFQLCLVVSRDDQPRSAYSISHRLFLCGRVLALAYMSHTGKPNAVR
jgi:hypothetical protein